jgi:hypothetical protein
MIRSTLINLIASSERQEKFRPLLDLAHQWCDETFPHGTKPLEPTPYPLPMKADARSLSNLLINRSHFALATRQERSQRVLPLLHSIGRSGSRFPVRQPQLVQFSQ